MGKHESKIGRMIRDKEVDVLKMFFDGYELYNPEIKIIGETFRILNDCYINVKTIRKYQSSWGGYCYEVDIEVKLDNITKNDFGYQRWLDRNKRYFNRRVRNRVHRTLYLGFQEIGLIKNINMVIDKIIIL